MKSRITKLAAAAVFVIVVIIGINRFNNFFRSNAFAGAVEQLNEAHTLTYSVITKTNIVSMPTMRTLWLYKEPGYMRAATPDAFFAVVFDTAKGKGIGILPSDKKYIGMEMTNIPADPACRSLLIIEKLRALPPRPNETLGRKEIDGEVAEGFRVIKGDTATTIWINHDTNKLVCVEMEFLDNPDMNIVMKDFHLDAKLDDSLFSLTPPAGFESMPARIQADVSGITEQHVNEFLGVWAKYRADGGSFLPKIGGSDFAKAVYAMAQYDKLIDVTRRQPGVKIVYP